MGTYVAKFSDSMADEWLNDDASDFSVARNVLTKYHPLEPEMWLQLADGRLFPHCLYGGSIVSIVAPWPGIETKPDFVAAYERCAWRGKDMSLLEYLRKANKQGSIVDWVKKLGLDIFDFFHLLAISTPRENSKTCCPPPLPRSHLPS